MMEIKTSNDTVEDSHKPGYENPPVTFCITPGMIQLEAKTPKTMQITGLYS